ncbi:MAG: Histidinol dehydrogenase [Verrucomicrobiae bacterium]|nr:Histidinol dehydrogenase [Verrucomicrobiae bacterium]
MRVFRYDQKDFVVAVAQASAASSLFDAAIDERVRAIIADVRARGDTALVELTERFDKVRPTQFRVTDPTPDVSADLKRAIAVAHKNVADFAKKSRRRNWAMKNAQGASVGEKFEGFARVGIYIPGGKAPLVSTVLMTVTLAKVAGCKEIVVCTPPPINPQILYACRKAGATEIYQLGGAQAIAALALGTGAVKQVQKIFGPGNAYVVAAKRLLFGNVAIDLLPGPSEVLIVADDSANPSFIAADMLAQAEHGSGDERVWLVTTSEQILLETQAEIDRQLPACARREFIEKALDHAGVAVLVKDLKQAVAIANDFAPEHCELMTKNNPTLAIQIKTAGAIFLGNYSPTVTGDYVAGPSHTLPTGGAGKAFAGLTVDQFQRRTSVVEYSAKALARTLPAIETFGAVEGLDAHAKSARIRRP